MKTVAKIPYQKECNKVVFVKGVIKKQLFTGLIESEEMDDNYLKESLVLLKRLVEEKDDDATQ